MTLSSRSILKIYKSLDKEQIQLVIEEKIEGKHDIHHWLKKLHKLAVMDTLGDDVREKSRDLLIVFLIFTVFTSILTIAKPFLFFFPIGFFLLFFYFLMMYFTLNKIDIGNNLRIFIVPMLEQLNMHYKIEDPFYMKMDFSNPRKKKYLVNSTDPENENRKIFIQPWMEGTLTFDDQVRIQWTIVDTVNERRKGLSETASRLGLTQKFSVLHQLKMHFQIPKDNFELIKKDQDMDEMDNFYIVKMNKEDESSSIYEGMDPEVFLETIREGYEKIRKKKKLRT
jgi:hypothetical protein